MMLLIGLLSGKRRTKMKRRVCSYCDGEGRIKAVVEEALEQALCQLLRLHAEPDNSDYIPCTKCNGTGIELEVEMEDMCRVLP